MDPCPPPTGRARASVRRGGLLRGGFPEGGWGRPGKTFALGLGCEPRHAHRLVYSTGLDLADESAATPIGLGCKVCERPARPQRSAPPGGRPPAVDQHTGTFVPYPLRTGQGR